MKSAFYGLRPIITGLIVYATLKFVIFNDVIASMSWHTVSLLTIFNLSLFDLIRLRIHPIFVITLSGLAGVVLY